MGEAKRKRRIFPTNQKIPAYKRKIQKTVTYNVLQKHNTDLIKMKRKMELMHYLPLTRIGF